MCVAQRAISFVFGAPQRVTYNTGHRPWPSAPRFAPFFIPIRHSIVEVSVLLTVCVIYNIIIYFGCQSLKNSLKSLISRHTPRASGDGGRGERVIENKEDEYAVEFTLLKTANQLARLDGALLLTPDRCRTRTTTAGSSSTGIIFQSMAAAPSEARTARSCVCTLRTRSTTCFCARWPNLPSVRRDGATISAALAAAGVK